ncbi:MAG: hypothetical protein ACYDHN_16105 [Solirubrobacteraceae bacterium]
MALLIIVSVAAVTSAATGVAVCRTAAHDDALELRVIAARRRQLAATRVCRPASRPPVFLIDEREDDTLSIAIGAPASDPRRAPH